MLVLLSALAYTGLYNTAFYRAVSQYVGSDQPLLMVKLVLLLFLVNHLLTGLLCFRLTLKPVLVFLFLIAALSSYFMNQYGILIDRSMLQNAMETDINEARGLICGDMFVHLAIFFMAPVILLWVFRVSWPSSLLKSLWYWLLPLVVDVLLILVLALTSYDEMASTFRNHRDLKTLAVPVNTVAAMASYAGKAIAVQGAHHEFRQLGLDARVVPGVAGRDKPNLVIFVLGETARADHFGLNGYPRQTTPELDQLARQQGGILVNFPAVSSCGTATALSVPCMFSRQTRRHYDEAVAKNSDNFLDIMNRAGISTLWIENNSGCKGMCERIATLETEEDPDLCRDGHCADRALLETARGQLQGTDGRDRFVVLHQQGSHGPEYYKRSLPDQKQFLPECESNELQRCELGSIINAYDNSIRATDELLAGSIRTLESLSGDYHTALVYVSDHGESLGENGLYLHGVPYMLAPETQTHVPMVMWFSRGFARANGLDTDCLQKVAEQPQSHDVLFASMLALMNVSTEAIQPELDIFRSCRGL